MSTEMAIRWALDRPTPIRDLRAACSGSAATSHMWIRVSAELDMRARDATVRNWGCDATTNEPLEGRLCECLLDQLPEELQIVLPETVADRDLTSYRGVLSIQL
jgi:hypothetical protein